MPAAESYTPVSRLAVAGAPEFKERSVFRINVDPAQGGIDVTRPFDVTVTATRSAADGGGLSLPITAQVTLPQAFRLAPPAPDTPLWKEFWLKKQPQIAVLGVMLGLAVGIDYSLFILNRHRTQLRNGLPLEESIGLANGTSGNAVVFAGITVIVALVGLNVTGIPFLGLMGTVGAVCVAVAVLVAVTLTPALLSLAGMRPELVAEHEVGAHPRHFTQLEDLVLVAAQEGDRIDVLRRQGEQLSVAAEPIPAPSVACLAVRP